jgi:hypothetical protein
MEIHLKSYAAAWFTDSHGIVIRLTASGVQSETCDMRALDWSGMPWDPLYSIEIASQYEDTNGICFPDLITWLQC